MFVPMVHAQNRNSVVIPPGGTKGYLYKWSCANDVNIAPSGYHVPTTLELNTFINRLYLAHINTSGEVLKSITGWGGVGNNGTDLYGFYGVPSGYREPDGDFFNLSFFLNFWASDEFSATEASYFRLTVSDDATTNNLSKDWGFSIRMMKDDAVNDGYVEDFDGNIYKTVEVLGYVFTAQNWKCTHLNDGTLIPTITDDTLWQNEAGIAKCAYNNNESLV